MRSSYRQAIIMLIVLLCAELGCQHVAPTSSPERVYIPSQVHTQRHEQVPEKPIRIVTVTPTSITLAWDANSEPNVAGYRVYWGTVSHTYNQVGDAGHQTSFTVTNLTQGTLYYFAAKAYTTLGVESNFSNEISYRPPLPTPTPSPSPTSTPTVTPTPLPTASPTPSLSPSPTPRPSASPTATASPSPTPAWILIEGSIVDCSKQAPVSGVTVFWTGDTSGSTLSDANGHYAFLVPSGAQFVIIPSKQALTPGDQHINAVDILAVTGQILGLSQLPCPAAADVNGDGFISTIDTIAIQRFSLAISSGTGFAGQYRFIQDMGTYDFTSALIGDVR